MEAFFYHASAFRAYIRRNKLVSDYQRSSYRTSLSIPPIAEAGGNQNKNFSNQKGAKRKKAGCRY